MKLRMVHKTVVRRNCKAQAIWVRRAGSTLFYVSEPWTLSRNRSKCTLGCIEPYNEDSGGCPLLLGSSLH
ncbi:hypothetical protein FRX31_009742 [Thalictrum thalictroides]|uniref:Uncharacterized protein n=1 Tax=Thalictrum thalictroides TaxID=46969 RepID=A0A7J6WVM7_THATH|nr:hypothetical protein FRX31_009742 [Thalictrum thalictroides]